MVGGGTPFAEKSSMPFVHRAVFGAHLVTHGRYEINLPHLGKHTQSWLHDLHRANVSLRHPRKGNGPCRVIY